MEAPKEATEPSGRRKKAITVLVYTTVALFSGVNFSCSAYNFYDMVLKQYFTRDLNFDVNKVKYLPLAPPDNSSRDVRLYQGQKL